MAFANNPQILKARAFLSAKGSTFMALMDLLTLASVLRLPQEPGMQHVVASGN